jgi:hypothetical protein
VGVRKLWAPAFQGIPLLLLLLLFASLPAVAQLKQAKKVLIVEDQMSAPAVETVARAFEQDLASKLLDPIDFYRESLDTFLIPEGNHQADVRKWYGISLQARAKTAHAIVKLQPLRSLTSAAEAILLRVP